MVGSPQGIAPLRPAGRKQSPASGHPVVMDNHAPCSDNALDHEAGSDLMANFTAERHRIQVLIGNCHIRLPLTP
jgi:hypothetical protein